MREDVILAGLVLCPEFVDEFAGRLEVIAPAGGWRAALRDVLLHGVRPEDMRARAQEVIGVQALEDLLKARHVAVVPCLRKGDDKEAIRLTVAGEFAKLAAARGLSAELAEAAMDLENGDETLTWRLGEAARAQARAGRMQKEGDTEYVTAPNGAQMDRSEKDALEALLAQIRFEKGR